MNEKEVAEIRRRFRPDRTAITHVLGCYVNETREIISQFDQSMAMLSPEETEKLMGLLRRTLSGTLGKNLTDITFTTQQVVDSPEHRLLMDLRGSGLQDQQAVQALFQQIIDHLALEGNYLILLAFDRYDVPFKGKDGESFEEGSDQVFSYVLCSVCPVKQTKPALSFYVNENAFHNLSPDWVVGAPELGFLFPAFDDRSTNLYNALYYCRDTAENHQEFVDALFRAPILMAPAAQKETFQAILGDTLAEDCSLEVVQAVHEQLATLIEEHKANKEPEPLVISKGTVNSVLETCGICHERVCDFGAEFDSQFGPDADLSPKNLVDPKKLELKTPDVTIQVNAERSDLVQTRIIDGAKYILIRADEGVEVNGVNIHII